MKTLKEKLSDVEKLLDEYEKKIGLPALKDCDEIECLNWTLDDIKNKTSEQLYDQLFVLSSFSLNIQRVINHKTTRANWAASNLRIVFGAEAQSYPIYSYEGQKNAVIANNEYALRLHELVTNSQAVIDRLSYLPAKIDFMVKQIDSILRNRKELSYAARTS
jgi:hypothetical protein